MKNEIKVYTGNKASGYTISRGGISHTTSEENARRNGTIKNDVPTWAKCCGWNKK